MVPSLTARAELLPDKPSLPSPGMRLVCLAWRINLPGSWPFKVGFVKTAEDRRVMGD